jgi:DNA-binding CsgD family transcriptional regulator
MVERTPKGYVTPERKETYAIWRGMLRRCYSPLCKEWQFYGGKGIAVCTRWLEFANFLEDMGLRPEGHTIDRKNPKGNYELSNCRWATRHQQATENRTWKKGPRPGRGPVTQLKELSPREQDVAKRLHLGLADRDIAAELGIAVQTERSYVKTLYRRVGLRTRAQLAVWVERQLQARKRKPATETTTTPSADACTPS